MMLSKDRNYSPTSGMQVDRNSKPSAGDNWEYNRTCSGVSTRTGESDKFGSGSKEEILEAAEILIKYQGYIDRERMIAEKLARLESIKIKGKFDYSTIQSLSTEARQKLAKIDPETIAQASRIPGVSPSDINVLLVLSGR